MQKNIIVKIYIQTIFMTSALLASEIKFPLCFGMRPFFFFFAML